MKRQSRRSHERGMSPCVRYSRPGRHWHEIRADIAGRGRIRIGNLVGDCIAEYVEAVSVKGVKDELS